MFFLFQERHMTESLTGGFEDSLPLNSSGDSSISRMECSFCGNCLLATSENAYKGIIKSFKTVVVLDHIRNSTEVPYKPVQCSTCGSNFGTRWTYKNHCRMAENHEKEDMNVRRFWRLSTIRTYEGRSKSSKPEVLPEKLEGWNLEPIQAQSIQLCMEKIRLLAIIRVAWHRVL